LTKKRNVKALAIYARDVTEARKYEEALQESEEKYRSVFESLQDVYYRTDSEGRIIIISPSVRAQAGYDPEDIIGHQVTDFYYNPSDREIFKTKLKESGVINDYELKLKAKDGRVIEVSTTSKIIYGEDGSPVGVEGIMRDITERKRAEEALQESEEQFRDLVEKSGIAIVIDDSEGNFKYFNDKFARLFGYTPEEMKKISPPEFIHPDDLERNMEFHKKRIQGENPPSRYEFRGIKKDGSVIHLEIDVVPFKENGKITGTHSYLWDITERKQAEEALRESEERLSGFMNSAADSFYLLDSELNFVEINERGLEIIGKKKEEVIGKNITDIVPNVKESGRYDKHLEVMRTGRPFSVEDFVPHPMFGNKHFLLKSFKVGDGLGVIASDITERKQAEQELQKLASVIHYSSELVNLATLDGKMIFLNEAGSKMLGIDPKAVEKHNIMEVIPEHLVDRVTNELLPALIKHGKWEGELQYRNIKTRGLTDVHAMCFTVKDPKTGAPKYLANVSLDITERKHEREKLKESYKKLQKAITGNIQLMATTVEIRDPYTAGHQKRVADLAHAIATEMALPEDKIEGIYMAGVIHDLGKISVPSEILRKPGKLTEMEFNLIKTHPQVGFDILREIEFPWPIAQIVYQHHERMDGLGYPQGLSGEKILLEARIMCVADVVEAMASHRPYRPTLGIDVALGEIKKNKGKLYDPDVADACLNLFAENKFKFTD